MTTNTNKRLKFKNNLARDPKSKRWHVRVRVNGKRIQKGGFPSKASAQLFLEHRVLTAAGVPVEGPMPTLEEACDSYIERTHLLSRSEDTVLYYEAKVPILTRGLGNPPLNRISQEDIEEYVRARKGEVAAATINKELKFLRTLYRHSELEPNWSLMSLSEKSKRRFVQPKEVVVRLWETLSEPTRAAVGLCLLTGVRQKTAYSAEASWVHGNELWVPFSKTGESFKTYLVPTLVEILPTDGKLVTKHKVAVRSELKRKSIKLGIDPAYQGPGIFRHHCGTYMAECGVSPDVIKLVLAHRVGGSTDRYLQGNPVGLKKDALLKVEGYIFQ